MNVWFVILNNKGPSPYLTFFQVRFLFDHIYWKSWNSSHFSPPNLFISYCLLILDIKIFFFVHLVNPFFKKTSIDCDKWHNKRGTRNEKKTYDSRIHHEQHVTQKTVSPAADVGSPIGSLTHKVKSTWRVMKTRSFINMAGPFREKGKISNVNSQISCIIVMNVDGYSHVAAMLDTWCLFFVWCWILLAVVTQCRVFRVPLLEALPGEQRRSRIYGRTPVAKSRDSFESDFCSEIYFFLKIYFLLGRN